MVNDSYDRYRPRWREHTEDWESVCYFEDAALTLGVDAVVRPNFRDRARFRSHADGRIVSMRGHGRRQVVTVRCDDGTQYTDIPLLALVPIY